MDYLLLASDLDGTLMGDDMLISPRTRSALREAQQKGIRVTIATGRTGSQVIPFAQELGIHTPLICSQGALVFDRDSDRVLLHTLLPHHLLRRAVQIARERKLLLVVFDREGAYVDSLEPFGEFYRRFTLSMQEAGDLLAFPPPDPMKFLVYASPEEIPGIAELLKQHFGDELQIVRTHSMIVEGVPLGVSKGRALSLLAEYLGVPRQATVAIGDQDNDVDMLSWAGLGIAMQNGTEAVKRAADVVTPPLSEDGAAQAIERYLLGK